MDSIGKYIKKIRLERQWSQGEMAKRLNFSVANLSKIENSITNVNMVRLYQIARLFDMSVFQLISGELTEDYVTNLVLQEKLKARNAELIDIQRKFIELFDKISEMERCEK
jgi:transcriptional regulator with XRE-family HTH domain